MKISLKEDDVVYCIVKKIEGTTVFLDVEGGYSGSMVLSEVSAGRIRNLKKYVSPNRKIVCKVLKVKPDYVEVSLRRVTAKEKEEVLERHKKEKALGSLFKVVGADPEKLIQEIKEKYDDVLDFYDAVRESQDVLEEFLPKDKAERVFQAISEKEKREKIVVAKFVLKSDSENGLKDIKEILDVPGVEIHYLGSGKFTVSVSGKDFKEANQKLEDVLEEIEKRAKGKKAEFELGKEKGK